MQMLKFLQETKIMLIVQLWKPCCRRSKHEAGHSSAPR